MTDEEIIRVVSAHKEGKKIQYVLREASKWGSQTNDMLWRDLGNHHDWNFIYYIYRVAPEPRKPREWTLAIERSTGHVYRAIENQPINQNFEDELVHVIEVIE